MQTGSLRSGLTEIFINKGVIIFMFDTKVQEITLVNGVNVDELVGTIEAVKEQPELAKMQFRAGNE